ncbi:hypothetical protein SARC_04993 [Sphaeroforma arctica JP610]|uniref:Uncharacterized protein n=1 Tax=Sphaeroforma arctica JP610 TaxID=667725 RepID=A0A0L0G0T3_9EUKA|nr:hypothetical protein SARC_04993 [Sphaeroforma arctica JP610]KNC82722.1 hypothetical protein SARC_04993 [Sphaeroforma arctica JP610]|eukprot:XP_014156624.1 hypothetical protein SARC_04993 [Sphaeroforma arctica JP610]
MWFGCSASPADDPTSETQTQLNEKDEKVKALASTIAEMERERDTTQEENKKLGLETKALQEKVDVFVEQGQQKDKDIEHDKRLAEEKRVSEQETNASDRLQAIEGAVAAAKEALSAEHAKHMQQYTSDKETEYQSEKEGLLKQIEALRSIVHDGQADGTTDTGDGNRELDTQIQELQTELVSKDEKIAKLLAQSKTLTTKLVTQARLEKALNAEIAALNERSTHFDSTAQHNSVNGALENGEANQQQAMAEETQRRFDEAQQTLAQKIEEIETLTATNKSLVAERDVFAGKVSSLESERIQLKSDSDKWKSEKSASEAELSAIGQERDTLKQDTEQERDTLQQEIAKEKDDHAKALEELVREKDSVTEELAGKVSELESEQARFKQDSDRWESEKSTLETEIRAVVQERDSLKQDTEHERDTLKQAIEQERDTLQRDMAKEKDDHAKALEELVRERDAMKESHTTLETQIEGTAKTLERAKRIEEKVGQLESDREKLETEVYNKTTELYELTTEVRGLRVQCAGMDALKTELAQAKQRVSRLTTEVQEKSELYDSSHAQLSSVKETLHARVREVEEQATMNLLALEKVEAELADEKANSKRLLREKQEATSLLKATKSTVEIEKKSLADVKKELADMSEAHASALKSKLQLTEQVEARNAEIDALVREKQVQENDYMEKLNALRTSTSDERQKMVEEHSKLLQEMDRSRKAISDDLADARSEYAVLQTERDGLVERVRVLEAEAATTAAVVEENCAAIAQAKADAERAQDAYESEVAVLSQKVDDSQRRIAELRATHEVECVCVVRLDWLLVTFVMLFDLFERTQLPIDLYAGVTGSQREG